MSKIEPFSEWINEKEEYSLADLKQMRELGLLTGDSFDLYRLSVDKFLSDPEVDAAIKTLQSKFDMYTELIFPYEENTEAWEQIRSSAEEYGIGELGWFEFLMFNQ